jgi:hypothetical protein
MACSSPWACADARLGFGGADAGKRQRLQATDGWMSICNCTKINVKNFFTLCEDELQQDLRGVHALAATRQASIGEPVYDRHDSAVMQMNDSAVTGG